MTRLSRARRSPRLPGAFRPAMWGARPYRAPHHTASAVALVGGGSDPRPGEISLAHHGVLFLDELPEWDRRVLEVLREPLESGVIHISRAARQSTFPAEFQFVSAMNPCPCGWLGHASGRCRCLPDQIARYRAACPGRCSTGSTSASKCRRSRRKRSRSGRSPVKRRRRSASTSARGADEVTAARNRQLARQGKPNARLAPREIEANCRPDSAGAALLAQRDGAPVALGARVSPHPEGRADDRGSRGRRARLLRRTSRRRSRIGGSIGCDAAIRWRISQRVQGTALREQRSIPPLVR